MGKSYAMSKYHNTRIVLSIWVMLMLFILSVNATLQHPKTSHNGVSRQLVSLHDQVVQTTTNLPRKDPMNYFRVYEGGFNIKDPHYWSSVVFTGAWAFSLALVCLVIGIIATIWWFPNIKQIMPMSIISQNAGILKKLYYFCIVVLTIFTIISSGVIFWGSQNSGQQLMDSTNVVGAKVDDVVYQVDHAVEVVENATSPMMSESLSNSVQEACDKLTNTAKDLQSHFRGGKQKFKSIYSKIKAMISVVAITIPIIAFIGLASILKVWHRILRICFAVMVILLFTTWLLAGVYFVLSNVSTDACQAMKQYEENPESSTFSKLLPCLKPIEATKNLNTAKSAIKNLIGQMNSAIDLVNQREEMMASTYNNGSYNIRLKHFCDPYGPPPEYIDLQCSLNDSTFSTFTTDYAKFRCNEDVVKHCFEHNTPIPTTYYSLFMVSVSAAKEVTTFLPSLYGIMTCNFIKQAFVDITSNHCGDIEGSFNALWIGFTTTSIIMMFLLILWIVVRKHLRSSSDMKFNFIYSPFGLPM